MGTSGLFFTEVLAEFFFTEVLAEFFFTEVLAEFFFTEVLAEFFLLRYWLNSFQHVNYCMIVRISVESQESCMLCQG